jgi:hypothetical protein
MVNLFGGHKNALNEVDLILFGALLAVFILLTGISIALKAAGHISGAFMAVGLSDIGLILTAWFPLNGLCLPASWSRLEYSACRWPWA